MDRDPFEKYYKASEPSKRDLGYAWQTAIGLQAVDHLTPSAYLIQTAQRNIEGEISIEEAKGLIDSYYAEHPKPRENRTEEADKVSARIAEILSEKSFVFSPAQYLSIHRRLFLGIYSHAGQIRRYNITKKEWVLAGDTVIYGGASELLATLQYDLSIERDFSYAGLPMTEIIRHLSVFVSRLWQIHAFSEGNTRTTAVFFIQYLRALGFQAANDIFAENAWYFRNALVRANYSNLGKNVHETTEFLEAFLRNLLLGEHNALLNRRLHIDWDEKQDIHPKKQDIGTEKQDIAPSKQDIHPKKQDIERDIGQESPAERLIARLNALSATDKTRTHIHALFRRYGFETIFGRSDVMDVLHITPSPASTLISRMRAACLIEAVPGIGKGKYRFIP